jgi:hypothetical protein
MAVEKRNPTVGLLYGRVFPIDSKDQWHLREAEMVGWGEATPGWIFDKLIMMNVIPTPTVVVKKACLDRVGLFDKSITYCEDWDLWLRIALLYDVAFVPEALAGATVYDDIPARLAAYRSDESQVRILDKVFSNLPEERSHLASLKPLAVARIHLAAACRDYALGQIPRAKESLMEAISLDTTLLDDTDRFVAAVVDHGFHFAGPSGSYRDVLPLIETTFSNLPPAAEEYRGAKSKARSRAHIVDAFRSYGMGDLALARSNALRGILGDPSWLTNRGVILIALKALLGEELIERLKGSGSERTGRRARFASTVDHLPSGFGGGR